MLIKDSVIKFSFKLQLKKITMNLVKYYEAKSI